jgi:type II secretory ATPase GspE/PulE/Tfp pilus assembly ATPase PilB-like protein
VNNEPSAPKALEELVHRAEAAGASDIHLQMLGKSAEVAFRLDGVMTPASTLPEEIAERVFGRIKFLAKLKTYQQSLPQDGRIDKADLAARSDLRVATYPTVTGEKIVLRLFTSASTIGLDQLGFPSAVERPQPFTRASSIWPPKAGATLSRSKIRRSRSWLGSCKPRSMKPAD